MRFLYWYQHRCGLFDDSERRMDAGRKGQQGEPLDALTRSLCSRSAHAVRAYDYNYSIPVTMLAPTTDNCMHTETRIIVKKRGFQAMLTSCILLQCAGLH